MQILDKYRDCFRRAFHLDEGEAVDGFAYQSNPAWDSVGHLALITEIENSFEVQLDVDDVIDFSSFEIGKGILTKYGVHFS
jgi:acyl carrier protein